NRICLSSGDQSGLVPAPRSTRLRPEKSTISERAGCEPEALNTSRLPSCDQRGASSHLKASMNTTFRTPDPSGFITKIVRGGNSSPDRAGGSAAVATVAAAVQATRTIFVTEYANAWRFMNRTQFFCQRSRYSPTDQAHHSNLIPDFVAAAHTNGDNRPIGGDV